MKQVITYIYHKKQNNYSPCVLYADLNEHANPITRHFKNCLCFTLPISKYKLARFSKIITILSQMLVPNMAQQSKYSEICIH